MALVIRIRFSCLIQLCAGAMYIPIPVLRRLLAPFASRFPASHANATTGRALAITQEHTQIVAA